MDTAKKENSELLYEYYLNLSKKRRKEAIELLDKRDFYTLRDGYIQYFFTKRKEITIPSNLISVVIEKLQDIKNSILPNETEPTVSSYFDDINDEPKIEVESVIYTICEEARCESMAKRWTRDSLWKLEYQPNGRDAKRYMELLGKLKNQ